MPNKNEHEDDRIGFDRSTFWFIVLIVGLAAFVTLPESDSPVDFLLNTLKIIGIGIGVFALWCSPLIYVYIVDVMTHDKDDEDDNDEGDS